MVWQAGQGAARSGKDRQGRHGMLWFGAVQRGSAGPGKRSDSRRPAFPGEQVGTRERNDGNMNRTKRWLWVLSGMSVGAMIALLILMFAKGGATLLYCIGGFSAGMTLGWCQSELHSGANDDEEEEMEG